MLTGYRTCYNWLLSFALLFLAVILSGVTHYDAMLTLESQRPEAVITVIIGCSLCLIIITSMLRSNELQNRNITTFASDMGSQNRLANVLDSLPDGIIIADTNKINYLN